MSARALYAALSVAPRPWVFAFCLTLFFARARARASERETFSALYKADGNFEVEAIFLRSAKMRFARGKARGFYGVCTVTAFSEDRAFLVISLRRRSIYIY